MAEERKGSGDCCEACGYAARVSSGEVEPAPEGAPLRVRVDAEGRPLGVVLVVESGGEVRRIRVEKPEIVVGRGKACDVVVPVATLSRQQMRLRFTGDGVTLEDLQSACGTYLNGRQVQAARVHEGHTIQAADLRILVLVSG